jgi:hypothetical protein
MSYGYWEPTGSIEKRAGYKLFLECKCCCGCVSWIRESELTTGRSKSCGCKRGELVSKADSNFSTTQPRVEKYFVEMFDGSNIGTRWASGEPTDQNPWFASVMEPPPEARAMTKEEAESWKFQRIKHRLGQNRPYGTMIVRQL